jgi:WD40 repeat protein
VQRFGYETSQIHGRFIKGKLSRLVLFRKYVFEHCVGDLRSNEFVCGSRDGCIRLWDVRSLKDPFAIVSRAPGDKIHLTSQSR